MCLWQSGWKYLDIQDLEHNFSSFFPSFLTLCLLLLFLKLISLANGNFFGLTAVEEIVVVTKRKGGKPSVKTSVFSFFSLPSCLKWKRRWREKAGGRVWTQPSFWCSGFLHKLDRTCLELYSVRCEKCLTAGGQMTETNPCGKCSATNGVWLLDCWALRTACETFRNLFLRYTLKKWKISCSNLVDVKKNRKIKFVL